MPSIDATLNTAKRKRARYVADTIGMVLRQNKLLKADHPLVFISTIGQLRFIREMLNRATK